jgi:hypothetical protein
MMPAKGAQPSIPIEHDHDSEEFPGRRSHFSNVLRDVLILSVAVGGAVLGGSVAPWAWCIMLTLTGLLLAIYPPKRFLGGRAEIAIAALPLLAVAGFLPSWAGFHSSWRTGLEKSFRLDLPGTISVQPWLTGEGLLLMLLGIGWIYLIAGRNWEFRSRHLITSAAVLLVFLVAALSIAQAFAGVTIVIWPSDHHLGPFPNRNQNALLFAATIVMTLPLAERDFVKRNPRLVLWGVSIAFMLVVLAIGKSRAGLFLLAIGGGVWVALRGFASPKRAAILGAIALIAGAAVLLFGGATVQRIVLGNGLDGILHDWRWAVQRDALTMCAHSGPFGIGLGNFNAVFGLFRDASMSFNRPIHPESDVLWMLAELGPFSIVAVAMVVVALSARLRPVATKRMGSLRSASCAVAVMAIIHAFVDVSAHRLGTFFIVVFFVGLGFHARPPVRGTESIASRATFRALGLFLVLGGVWIGSQVWWNSGLPGSATVEKRRSAAAFALDGKQYGVALAHINAALPIAPLDWRLYFRKAQILAATPGRAYAAARNFRLVRELEPANYNVTHTEIASLIAAKRPELIIPAVLEALKRRKYEAGPDPTGNMLGLLAAEPKVRDELLSMLAKTPADALELIVRAQVPATTALPVIAGWFAQDPNLEGFSESQRAHILRVMWSMPSERDALRVRIQNKPDWEASAWMLIAGEDVEAGRFEAAVRTALTHLAPPALPVRRPVTDRQMLERRLLVNRNDYVTAFDLYSFYEESGFWEDAAALCDRFSRDPDAPEYWRYLKCQIESKRGRWEEAWKAIEKYASLQAM